MKGYPRRRQGPERNDQFYPKAKKEETRKRGKFLFGMGITVLSLMFIFLVPAGAQDCIEINSLPCNITSPGHYCLTINLKYNDATGDAISIRSHGVIVDLMGYTLSNLSDAGPATAGTKAFGVRGYSVRNVTIRNGSIVGFGTGVGILDDTPEVLLSPYALIEDLRIINCRKTGISTSGNGHMIRRNYISFVSGLAGIGDYVTGIEAYGSETKILDNDIYGENFRMIGISVNSKSALVENNRLGYTGNLGVAIGVSRFESSSIGILLNGSGHLVLNNRSSRFALCFSLVSSGKYGGNRTMNCGHDYGGKLTIKTIPGYSWLSQVDPVSPQFMDIGDNK